VTGILGILKAGGAYVPLDSTYPRERLAFMLRDTDVQVLLTEQSLLPGFTDYMGQTVCLDRDLPLMEQEQEDNPPHQTVADNLAYVMYTSGSTGTPKGVMVPHRGVVRLVCGVDYMRLGAGHVYLLLAPVSFDASTFELWGALLHGAQCIVFPQDVPEIDRLESVIKRHRVTTLWLTASLFNMIIDESPHILSGVQQLLIGGEALSVSHVRRALESLPGTELINGYGPTESTTFACCYSIPRVLDERLDSVPIGRPIANTTVYVLDRNRNPVPAGIWGELYIGGDGLARGYLNQAELTAEKFVENPFSDNRQSRLYKTGDRVRYLADGNIEFLGRTDHQVKIRGFRIEPGEIENVMQGHDAVRQSVVTIDEDEVGDKRLLAYVVTQDGYVPDVEQLRDYLKERVPKYMLPAHYTFLEKLPLSPNGKIDRDALPQPEESGPPAEETFVAPRNSTEQRIAEIWCMLLKLERVGVHNNFFGLGGHSLLAIQIINRLEESFGLEVPLDVIFNSPSVAELAAYVDASMYTVYSDVSSPSNAGGGERESGEI
jgi:amino acid adenylation domain-containing protein